MTDRLFKNNGSTSGNLPQVTGLVMRKPEDQTTNIDSINNLNLNGITLNNQSDANIHSGLNSNPKNHMFTT